MTESCLKILLLYYTGKDNVIKIKIIKEESVNLCIIEDIFLT